MALELKGCRGCIDLRKGGLMADRNNTVTTLVSASSPAMWPVATKETFPWHLRYKKAIMLLEGDVH
jgi:hypothetical protein